MNYINLDLLFFNIFNFVPRDGQRVRQHVAQHFSVQHGTIQARFGRTSGMTQHACRLGWTDNFRQVSLKNTKRLEIS